jgi:hypothetical protein
MNDNMDSYLSRCLQNWTARSQTPDRRADLLRRAVEPEEPRENWLMQWLSAIPVRTHVSPELLYVHSHISTLGPFTLSTLWSFHLVANQRMAT